MSFHPVALARALRNGIAASLVHLLPARCFGCGKGLPRAQEHGACATCWSSLTPLRGPACSRCGVPIASLGPSTARCLRCVVDPLPLDGVVSAVVYEGFARSVLLRVKQGRRRELLGPLGGQLALAARRAGFDRADVIVPVPSRRAARLRRGFDPAASLAVAVSRATGVPLCGRILRVAPGRRAPAKSLSARDRRTVAPGRFVHRGDATGWRVLLVDDVMTTGATAAACSAALRSAGAIEVRLAVWARTPYRTF